MTRNLKLSTLILLVLLLIFIYFLIDFKSFFSDVETIRDFVLGYDPFSSLVFFLLQITQVIFAPIPGNVTIMVGGSLFGFFKGLLLNTASIYLGSLIAFSLARIYGKYWVQKLLGAEIFQRYSKIFEQKAGYFLFLIFLFPFFPDDALCFLAGLSSLSFGFFLFLLIFGRLPGIVVGTLVGAGLFQLTLTGWLLVLLFSLLIAYPFIKYYSSIQDWIEQKLFKNLFLLKKE